MCVCVPKNQGREKRANFHRVDVGRAEGKGKDGDGKKKEKKAEKSKGEEECRVKMREGGKNRRMGRDPKSYGYVCMYPPVVSVGERVKRSSCENECVRVGAAERGVP